MHISSETNFNYYSKFGQINTHEKPAWFFWWIFLFPHRCPLCGGGEDGEWELLNLSQFLPLQIRLKWQILFHSMIPHDPSYYTLFPSTFQYSSSYFISLFNEKCGENCPNSTNLGYCPYFSLSHPAKYPTHIYLYFTVSTFEATNYKKIPTNFKISQCIACPYFVCQTSWWF